MSAYALQDETKVDQYEKRYGDKVPLGCLVDLVQKGILYTKVNELVDKKSNIASADVIDMDLNMFGAIDEEKAKGQLKGRKVKKATDKPIQKLPQPKPDVVIPVKPAKPHPVTKLAQYYGFTKGFTSSWNPSVSELLAWGNDDPVAEICRLEPSKATGKPVPSTRQLPHPVTSRHVISVTWAPDGRSLVTASENGEVRMWDWDGSIRFIMALHHAPVVAVRWSPDGTHLLTMDASSRTVIWDSKTGQPVEHINSGLQNPGSGKMECFGTDACWIDNYKFVVPGQNYTLQVFQVGDVSQKPVGVLSGHTASISFVSYNQDLKLLCSASDDTTIRIWRGNSTNSLQILTGHSQPITYLHWIKSNGTASHSDGSNGWLLVSCSLDATLRVWDFVAGQCIHIHVMDDGQPIITACTSHSGQKLTTADSTGSIAVWKMTEAGDYVKQSVFESKLDASQSVVSSLSWSKDDSKVAVSCSGSSSVVLNV